MRARSSDGMLYVWQSGTHCGVTDDPQRAFGHAEAHCPQPPSAAVVTMARFHLSVIRVTGFYQPILTWTGTARDGIVEWSDEKAG